jgi:hypothetical protein
MKYLRCLFPVVLLLPAKLHAQVDTAFYSASAPGWTAQFSIASANMLLSGITAGITQELRGGSFRDGFARGAMGGLVIYGGKRIAADHFSGAGFVGRQVGAVGSSMVYNAGVGAGTFDRLVFPVGITRVYWQRPTGQVQVKVDAMALGWTIYGIIEPELEFDGGSTVSAGTPVFRTRGKVISFGNDSHAGGIVQSGAIYLSDVKQWGDAFLEKTFAHERVHTMQVDHLFLTLNEPHDDWLLKRAPFGRTINRWVDINLSTELLRLLAGAFDEHGNRPWELEAIYLTR